MMAYQPQPGPEKGWYAIPGYPGYYANRQGQIWIERTGHVTYGGVSGRYRRVSAYPDGADTPTLCYAHDLVCRAFHGLPEDGQVVLHDNDDRLDNASTNLGWGTQQANIQAVWDNGLRQRVSREDYQTPIWEGW